MKQILHTRMDTIPETACWPYTVMSVLLTLANKKFTRFRIKDKSEITFIKYVVSGPPFTETRHYKDKDYFEKEE